MKTCDKINKNILLFASITNGESEVTNESEKNNWTECSLWKVPLGPFVDSLSNRDIFIGQKRVQVQPKDHTYLG